MINRCHDTQVGDKSRCGLSRSRAKLLISAYACEPDTGGEPSVGWFWAYNAAQHGHQVHILTRSNNKEAVQSAISRAPSHVRERMQAHFLDLPFLCSWIKKNLGPLGLPLYYYLWQIRAIPTIRHINRLNDIDFAHHVTFCSDAVFSACAFGGRPFAWGPMGGLTHQLPAAFIESMTPSSRRKERFRRTIQFIFSRLDPLYYITCARATMAIYYSNESSRSRSGHCVGAIRVVRHVGVAESFVKRADVISDPSSTLVLTSVGRLVYWKGFDLAVKAVAQARQQNGTDVRLRIVGLGPQLPELRLLAQQLEIAEHVDFLGRLDRHEDVIAVMRSSDAFIQPTLRDGPPVAIIEAMASGIPVITAGFGATGELVPPNAGYVLSETTPAALVQGLAAAITDISKDRADSLRRASVAFEFVLQEMTWETIGNAQEQLYEEFQELISTGQHVGG